MFNIKSLITTMAGELWGVVEGSCPCSGTSWTLSPCWPLLHVWKCTKAPVTGHFLCVSERSFSQFCLGHAPIHLTAGKEIEEIHHSHCHPMPTCSHALSCAVVMSIGPVFFLCCTCNPLLNTTLHVKSLPSPPWRSLVILHSGNRFKYCCWESAKKLILSVIFLIPNNNKCSKPLFNPTPHGFGKKATQTQIPPCQHVVQATEP